MYLLLNKIQNGSYPPIINTDYFLSVPNGYLNFPENFIDEFYKPGKRAAGFVTITYDGTTVTSCVWNEEAYQAWCEANPEQPEPEPDASDTEVLNTLLGVSE